MGLEREFNEAVIAVEKIDFSTCALEELNVFETTIRYLGGLLAAWDISGRKHNSVLHKAMELGEVCAGFDFIVSLISLARSMTLMVSS